MCPTPLWGVGICHSPRRVAQARLWLAVSLGFLSSPKLFIESGFLATLTLFALDMASGSLARLGPNPLFSSSLALGPWLSGSPDPSDTSSLGPPGFLSPPRHPFRLSIFGRLSTQAAAFKI